MNGSSRRAGQELRRNSFGMVPCEVLADRRLGHAVVRVYGALRSFADGDGSNCRPSQTAIGKRAGMSRSTVSGHLRKLEELGFIEKTPRTNSAGASIASEYRFHDPAALPLSEHPTPPVGFSHSPIDDQTIDQTSSLRSQRARAAGFAEFWEKFPNKVGKRIAEKAYHSALARASPAELLTGLQRYVSTKPPDRQWCNPATWLNEDRWLDQPAPSVPLQREILLPINGHGGERPGTPAATGSAHIKNFPAVRELRSWMK